MHKLMQRLLSLQGNNDSVFWATIYNVRLMQLSQKSDLFTFQSSSLIFAFYQNNVVVVKKYVYIKNAYFLISRYFMHLTIAIYLLTLVDRPHMYS